MRRHRSPNPLRCRLGWHYWWPSTRWHDLDVDIVCTRCGARWLDDGEGTEP